MNPRGGFCTQACGCETMHTFDDLTLGDCRAPIMEQGAAKNTKRGFVNYEKIFFCVKVWANCLRDQVGLDLKEPSGRARRWPKQTYK